MQLKQPSDFPIPAGFQKLQFRTSLLSVYDLSWAVPVSVCHNSGVCVA